MRATRVSAPGGRRTAGLLLGLLCLVGLAAIPATTSVLADDTKADGKREKVKESSLRHADGVHPKSKS